MNDTLAKAISKRNIIYLDGFHIYVSTAVYNHLRSRVIKRGMGETVSEYVKLLYQWSPFEGHR
jgi:hypothetical protein